MTEISFDYETYSACDIGLGSWRYAEDPSTELLCFAWSVDNGQVHSWDVLNGWSSRDAKSALYLNIINGAEFWAFNANFERAITELVAPKHGIVFQIKPSQYRDTQAICAMTALPMSLELAGAYLGVNVQKEKAGKDLLKKFSWPDKAGKRTRPEDDPAAFARLVQYCKTDVIAEGEVRAACPVQHLPPGEQEIWTWDSAVNRRGVKVDLPLVRGAVKLVGIAEERERKKLIEVTGGKMTTENQGARAIALAAAEGYHLPNFQAPTVQAALADPACPPMTRAICRTRALIGMASTKKYAAMLAAASPRDGRIRNSLRYHKAHPGRWTGTIVQFQNIARPRYKLTEEDRELIRKADVETIDLLFPSLMALLRDAVRNAVVAETGKTLTVVDEASIEARVLGWMCDEPFYNDAYSKGIDLYVVMAAAIYGVPLELVDKIMRALGKESVLGLGYSMWVDTFMANCAKKGLRLPREMFEKAVRLYRRNCPNIVKGWADAEKAMAQAILTGNNFTAVKCVFGVVVRQGIKYAVIKLPSGRHLWYPKPECVMKTDKWGKLKSHITYDCRTDKGVFRSTLYGGLIIENIDQGISRDLLVITMLRVERELKIPIVMHVHDEGVWEAVRSYVAEIEAMMSITPSWAPGLILGAEGFSSPFYKKG